MPVALAGLAQSRWTRSTLPVAERRGENSLVPVVMLLGLPTFLDAVVVKVVFSQERYNLVGPAHS